MNVMKNLEILWELNTPPLEFTAYLLQLCSTHEMNGPTGGFHFQCKQLRTESKHDGARHGIGHPFFAPSACHLRTSGRLVRPASQAELLSICQQGFSVGHVNVMRRARPCFPSLTELQQ